MGKRKKKKSRSGTSTTPADGKHVGWTDGACAGNPGPMGIGGTLQDSSGTVLAQFSVAAGFGTNNEAEYLALIQLVELAGLCGAKGLRARTDSELVAKQYSGEYSARQPRMQALLAKVRRAAKSLPDGLVVEWVPRERNTVADALASRASGMPQAPLGGDAPLQWRLKAGFVPDDSLLSKLPSVDEQIPEFMAIANPRFADYMRLRTGGRDGYSAMKTPRLREVITIRHGADAVEWIDAALAQFEDTRYATTAMRWCARGLAPDMALKKASVDAEMAGRFVGNKKGR